MKNTIKILLLSIFILAMLSMLTCVNAATANITASKTSATVGDNVTITVNINAAAWNVSVSGGGVSGSIVGYNDDAVNMQTTKTYTLNTSSAGTYKVSITGDITDQSSDYSTPVNKSVTITVSNPAPTTPTQPTTPTTPTKPTTPSNNGGGTTTKPSNSSTTTTPTKSSNSKLSSLQIAEGVLAPEFSSSIKEYSISIPNEITKLSISAIPDSSKATVRISGNEDLKVGENPIEIVVTAEDGSATTYKLLVTRADEELALQKLALYYINENGERVDLNLNPVFAFNVYEYSLEKLPYTVKELKIEAISNKETAKIEILGNTELKAGSNEITIKVTVQNEDGLEEQKTYKITVEREEEPIPAAPLTMMEKIKNWFKGAGVTVTGWITENFNKIIATMLAIATTAFVGLTIYFAYDYKNYQKLLAKLAEYNKENLRERANVALNPENVGEENIETNVAPENIETDDTANNEQEVMEEKPKIKEARGKRYK